MHIGATVTTSQNWRRLHPKCKPRGPGVVIDIHPALNGALYSVRWSNGKYEQHAACSLVLSEPVDETGDYSTRQRG